VVKLRVARWHIFIPKLPIWADFGRPWNEIFRYILWPFDVEFGHLLNFVTMWYILWPYVIFSQFGILYQEKSGSPGETDRKLQFLTWQQITKL
jgi:hypothetical protein